MINTEKTVLTLKAVAMLTGLSLFLWSTGLPTLFFTAEAASIISASDTLTNSGPSQSSVHTIAFTLPNGMAQGQTFEVAFDAAFDTASLVVGDISMTVNGLASTTAAVPGATTWGIADVGTDTMTFTTSDNAGVASSSAIVITFGDEAGTLITNPAATTSYSIDIGKGASTMQDSGQVKVAIIDQVTVTAAVDTSLTFTVSGMSQGAGVNGTSTTLASTNTTIPFGTLVVDELETLAHSLAVTTNATNGYTVSVELSGDLQSSTGADINSFVDGADTSTPTAWVSPTPAIGNDKTWGHWGVTSDDTDAQRTDPEFGSNQWAGLATTSPTIVMGHNGPSDGTTAEIGTTTVGYQIEISALQEAGDDYNTTLRYIATPTF